MSFKYNESHKADRLELLKDIPSFTKLIDHLRQQKNMSKETRALFSILITCGSRIGECCQVKQHDITMYDYSDNEMPYKDIFLSNVAKMTITFNNFKNRRNKFKRIPVIKNEIFVDCIDWVIERMREQGYNPDALIYTKGRRVAWWDTKKYFSTNVFPHAFRHYQISNLVKAGVSPAIIKQAAGWSSLLPAEFYMHLSTKDIEETLKKNYGESIQGVGNPAKPLSHEQIAGAYMAAKEIKQIQIGPHNQTRSIINNENALASIHIPENSRKLRDEIRSNSPRIAENANQELLAARTTIAAKKQKTILPQNKETDLSTLVAVV